MPLSTDFTCPNGHEFKANAKLRARCPECGQMARRFGGTKRTEEPPKVDPPETPEVTPPVKTESEPPPVKQQPKIIRRGRTREPKVVTKAARKTVVNKNAGGIVKHKKVTSKAIPNVTGKPRGNREHKVAAEGSDKPYWHGVAERYWR